MNRLNRVFAAAPIVVALLSSACVAILPPDQDGSDDDVIRCDNSSDCEDAIDDNRYVGECIAVDGGPGVCAPNFATQGCNPEQVVTEDSPFFQTWDEASKSAAYVTCATGERGCRATMTGCVDDLVLNEFNICDEPGANVLAVGADQNGGQDVLDQFCRSFFCDEDYVCNATTFTCQRCVTSEGTELGEGRCAEVYVDGERSSVYTDGCGGSSVLAETLDEFGPVPG